MSSAAARAEPAIDPQLVKAPAGRLSAVSLPAAETLPAGGIVWGARLDHARRVLRLGCLAEGDCGPVTAVGTAVHSLSTGEVSLAVGAIDAVEVGAVLGFGAVEAARDASEWRQPRWAAGPTDARFSVKVGLPSHPFPFNPDHAVDRALWLVATVPTGAGGDYLGAHGPTLGLGTVSAVDFGAFALAGHLAYVLRRERTFGGLTVDDELQWGFGGALPLSAKVAFLLQGEARLGVFGPLFRDPQGKPVEAQLGVRIDLGDDLRLRIAAGTGVLFNPDGYGTSDYRVTVDLRGGRSPATCVLGPEDYDGYRDGDHCADPDNDGDGLPDERDACPNDAEDADGFADGDGCPDLDNDADGVLDGDDRCPEQSEDRDGHADDDGCPELDDDGDGRADVDDACPMDPEDLDGYHDDDGCPEPGPERLAVTVTDRRILVSERIYFEHDSEVIRSVSAPILDEVARAILALGGHRAVRVEGHTDTLGDPAYNLDLSFRRARSVLEYLVSRGVPRERLSHRGFGGSRPLTEGDSPEARALNRRVEFAISTDSAPQSLENAADRRD